MTTYFVYNKPGAPNNPDSLRYNYGYPIEQATFTEQSKAFSWFDAKYGIESYVLLNRRATS